MSVKFIILGSGSSMGVPRADGYSGNCDLDNVKNHRTRCSALIKFDDSKIHSAVNNSKFDRVNLYLKFSTDGCAEALEST